jgi:response regulator of citrate/malate metabolism
MVRPITTPTDDKTHLPKGINEDTLQAARDLIEAALTARRTESLGFVALVKVLRKAKVRGKIAISNEQAKAIVDHLVKEGELVQVPERDELTMS